MFHRLHNSLIESSFIGGGIIKQELQSKGIIVDEYPIFIGRSFEKLSIEQRKVLERVFDIITQEYDETTAEGFINIISYKF